MASRVAYVGPTWVSQGQFAEAFVVEAGKIEFVGTRQALDDFLATKPADARREGAFFMPGFQDAHVHPMSGGILEIQVNVHSAATLTEAQDRVRTYAATRPDLAWICGGGWQWIWFAELGGRPTAAMLDAAVPDRPAAIMSFDGHSVWVNSLGIAAVKGRPAEEGEGVFSEEDARAYEAFIGLGIFADSSSLPLNDRIRAMEIGLGKLAACGVTGFQDAIVHPGHLEAYQTAYTQGKLSLKGSLCLWFSLVWPPAQTLEWINNARAAAESVITDKRRLRISSVKYMLDGVLETQTAHLRECYCCNHHTTGRPNFEPAVLHDSFAALDKAHFQIHCHAIGDGACRSALDAFAHAREVNGTRDARHHIAHLQVVDPQDVPRFKSLGVGATFQPYWSIEDDDMRLAMAAIGPERSQWQYPIRTMVESGAHVAFGSDWFVSPIEPLWGIQVAVTHLPVKRGDNDPIFLPAEKISLDTALHLYTRGAAHTNFLEKSGAIAVGMDADFIEMDRNLFDVDAADIHKAVVLRTWVDGDLIYEKR